MHHSLFAVALLVVAPAFAQGNDEWNTFPPAPPAAATPKAAEPATGETPEVPRPPAQAPATAPAPAAAPVAAPPPTPKPTAAPAPAVDAGVTPAAPEPAADDARVISTKERWLAGTEPHSPSTWGKPVTAKENGRVTAGQAGIGTAWVPSARLGPAGVVRVSVLGEYLSLNDFPVKSAQDVRSAVTFAASFQPFEWGELFVSYGAAANSSNRTSPNLIQALGDVQLGLKVARHFGKGFHAGADLRLLTFSGVGNQGLDRFAFGFRPTALATWDVRELSAYAPLIFTAGVGATIDSTAGLVTNQRLNAAEEFALNVNRYHRLNVNASLEVPLPVLTPFVEYVLAMPLGVPNGELTGPDTKFVNVSSAMAQQLGLGLKVTAVKDLTLLAGVNLGLTRSVGLGVPATPPWNLFFGAGFAIDPFQRGETKLVETVREREKQVEAPQATARLEGTVTDQATGKPIPGVVVAVSGHRPAATDEKGQYQSLAIEAKSVKLSVSHPGYKPLEREVTVDAGKPTTADLALEPDLQKAKLAVSATAAKKPVKADFVIKGEAEFKAQAAEGAAAPTEVEVPPGTYTVTVTAPGFLAQTRDVQVGAGGALAVAFDLQPQPKKSLVAFKGDRIEILQQVRFASGLATILPESNGLLQQVVDAIVSNNVKRVRIEGHTDNRGVRSANQQLSEDRARAVKDYLVTQGIDAERLEAVGYGDSKPIAPNLTARGREINRRVEFIVLEK